MMGDLRLGRQAGQVTKSQAQRDSAANSSQMRWEGQQGDFLHTLQELSG